MSEPSFLVTGGCGCVGAWVAHELLANGQRVTTFDLSTDLRRLRLISGDVDAEPSHVTGDITDLSSLEHAIDEHEVTHVIHLAALQMPLVRGNPALGVRVNVLGTVNVFEAARRRPMAPVVYASSVAAYDPQGTMNAHPSTLYGIFKRSNEATAAVYHAEAGIASVGLRPHTVYGIGRDQGATSAPTTAMLAAAAGVPYTIPYTGRAQLQLARDVARWFIAASLAGTRIAEVHNLPGRATAMDELVTAICDTTEGVAIDCAANVLPLPSEVDSESFATLVPDFEETPLADGIAETVGRFRDLLAAGLVPPPL